MKKMLNTPHKKKSAGLTAFVGISLLLLFFMLGLTYYDPPVSYGMEVNFGNYAEGSGKVQPIKNVQTLYKIEEKQDEIDKKAESNPPKESILEPVSEMLTEKESDVSIPKKKESDKSARPVTEIPESQVKKEIVKDVPKVSEITKSVVTSLLKKKPEKGDVTKSEGNDLIQGDKGKIDGNPFSSTYYNNFGLGGRGKGYGLNGRNLQSNGKVIQDCNQEGTVVVRITVNNKGEVIQSEPGVKGSTNTHPCLLEPARKTALLHKWFPDNNAPAEQIGFVVIQFKLGE